MKKVKAIVLFDSSTNQIYNLTVLTNNENIPLIRYSPNDVVQPYKYPVFRDMYTSILNILKENNFYVNKWISFECTFYDIDFIDVNDPYRIVRYPY